MTIKQSLKNLGHEIKRFCILATSLVGGGFALTYGLDMINEDPACQATSGDEMMCRVYPESAVLEKKKYIDFTENQICDVTTSAREEFYNCTKLSEYNPRSAEDLNAQDFEKLRTKMVDLQDKHPMYWVNPKNL